MTPTDSGCPKCEAQTGDDWKQCNHRCPMPGSPHYDPGWRSWMQPPTQATEARWATVPTPIPMVMHCPRCAFKHIDKPEGDWLNPPHRSHLCASCGHIWRPADYPTEGVEAVQTRGDHDNPIAHHVVPEADRVKLRLALVKIREGTTHGNVTLHRRDVHEIAAEALK